MFYDVFLKACSVKLYPTQVSFVFLFLFFLFVVETNVHMVPFLRLGVTNFIYKVRFSFSLPCSHLSNVYVMYTIMCVCVCLCAKFVCQRNHNFWVFKSRNATPHTTVSHSQLEAARRQLGRGSAKFVFHASLPSVLKVKCKISKPVPAAQIIPFISAHKNVIQLSDVDFSVYHPSVTCSKVKLIEPIIKCCNNYTISWQIQN